MRKLFSIFVLSASLALAAPSTIVVQSGDTLGSIAARNGVSLQALLKANGLSTTSTLKIGQVLKLPGGSSSQKTGGITVQKGDTLGSIAKRYGVSVATLRAANGLSSNNVSVGQVLRLSGTVQSSSKTSSVTAKTSGGTVTVKSGDTLGEIAQQNGTTVAALKAANGLTSNNLKLGQILKLSGPSQSSAISKTSNTTKTTSSSSSSKSSSGTVTVQAGDTLGEIAQANGTTVAALKATNGLIGNDLKLGQVLKLPGSSTAQSSAARSSATKSSTTGKTNATTSSKNDTITVKAGDSLSKIALANGTTVSALRAKNGLTNDDLQLGQVLKLPSGNNPKPSNSSNTTTAKSPSLPSSVQVQKGDSLTKIAKQFGLSIETLRKLNNLKSDDLALGQTLRLKPAPVLAKTEKPSKPSSSSKPSTNTTVAKSNQNKPVTTTKPNTNKPSTTAAKPNSSTSSKPNSSTSKPTTANKPSSSTTANKPSKPATTSNSQNKPSLAKTDISKPATNQKPITAQTSSSPTKPTAQVSSNPTKPASTTSKPSTTPQIVTTPNPEPVVVKPAPAKPATVSSNKPTPQPAIAAKPSQPIVSTQPPKPVMNEATVPETPVDTSTTEATPNSSDSDPTAATDIAPSSSSSTSQTQDSTVPATQTEQSQSNVGSDADYIIIEPQNSLEIVGQRTGSALSTLPATPPSNATPQQRAKYTRERLLWPLQGVLTSYYGYRRLRIGRSHFHTGLDIAAPSGTPVYAALSGRVEQAGWSRVGYGKLVIIRGWDGRRYYYGHNSRILVKTGQWINQGTMISKVGSTGYATGPHLHFEVRIGGHTRNPLAYLPRSQVQFARYAPKR